MPTNTVPYMGDTNTTRMVASLGKKHLKELIKQASMISQISTTLPLEEDNLVMNFQMKDLIGLDLPHNDFFIISIQIA
ncbi:unnamed protein product [Prunus brigantina]